MIGVRAPSFSKTYQDGSVFAELDTVASFGGGAARVRPGAEEPFLDANGQPVLGPDGAPLLKKKMPKLGDVVIIASDSGQHGHVFVVTESPDPATHAGIVKRQDQFGRWRAFFDQLVHGGPRRAVRDGQVPRRRLVHGHERGESCARLERLGLGRPQSSILDRCRRPWRRKGRGACQRHLQGRRRLRRRPYHHS